jgi:predicted nuclease of predicted toxin-antitoxin system
LAASVVALETLASHRYNESLALKLYTDTHIAKTVAIQLRQRNIDIVRCEEVDMASVRDLEHLAYAAAQERAIITNDQGFAGHHRQWLEQGKHHAGIFLITKGKDDIGMIVTTLAFWRDAIDDGAATIESDVNDQIIYLP